MKYTILARSGNTVMEADNVRVMGGALAIVRDNRVVFILAEGAWTSVSEGGQEIARQIPAMSGEPGVPTRMLKRWVERVREVSPSGTFPFDGELMGLIRDADGGHPVAPEPPSPREVKTGGDVPKPARGKLD